MISNNYLASPGQLGNQMFKYASLKGIAFNNNLDYLLPPSKKFYNYSYLKSLHKKFYNYPYQNHYLFEYFNIKKKYSNKIRFSENFTTVKEDSIFFDEKIFNSCKSNTNLSGFFQSYLYFEEINKEIKEDFKFKSKYLVSAKKILNNFPEIISIHVRRSDFIHNPNHFSLGLDYYEEAVDKFSSNSLFAVFTDDPNWVSKQNFFNRKNFLLVSKITGKSTPIDLCAMTLCNNHIISNSTYSWWGAWLSKQDKVVYPCNWFPNKETLTRDLFPTSWLGIDNTVVI